MPQPIATQLGTFTGTGVGTPRAGQVGDHTFSASVSGAGAVSATVLIEVSNDNVGWSTLATLSPAGTTVGSAQATSTSSYSYWRTTVSALTGTSVVVSAATEQVTDASQLTSSQKSRLMAVLPATESLVSGDGYIFTWAARPSAAANTGKVIRITDVGHTTDGTLMKSDGVYWRPVGGQVHFVCRAGSPFYPLTQNTGSTGFNFTLPLAPVIPADFLIPGESQIECEVWVKKVGANGTATLNVYLGLNNSNASDYRIVQGTFAAADGSELALRPLVTVGNAIRMSSATFLTVGSVTPQTAPGTDSAGGMFNSATPTYLTINVGAANVGDTFRLIAYRLTVRQ